MKRVLISLLCCFLLGGCALPSQEPAPAKPTSGNTRCAVWLSYLELRQMLGGQDAVSFTARVSETMAALQSLGVTDLLVQVRPFGDAIYPSDIFPPSAVASGTYNLPLSYDPLPILIDGAHGFGMKIHGWINPLRLATAEELATLSADSSLGHWLGTDAIRMVDGRGYLNPAYPEVRELICDGVTELLRYDLDGIHLDDYFYPTTDPSFDQTAYEAASAESGVTLGDFRREQISLLVSALYQRVKEAKPEALFGISPAGNIKNNQEKLYADVTRWASEPGFVDYLMPQLYFGYAHETLPFSSALSMWETICTEESVSLWVGLACYKAGQEDNYAGAGRTEWLTDTDLLARQVEQLAADPQVAGIALYRSGTILSPAAGVQTEAISNMKDALGAVLG